MAVVGIAYMLLYEPWRESRIGVVSHFEPRVICIVTKFA